MRWLLAGFLIALPLRTLAGTDEYENKKALAYLKVGSQRQEAGNCKDAVNVFKRGLEHRPLPDLYLHLGQCHKTLGDGPAASAAFRAYLKATPGAADRAEIERYLASGAAGSSAPPPTSPTPPPGPAARPASGRTASAPAAPATDPEERDPFSEPARKPVEKCQPGMVRSSASGGHCCWPEQVWAAGEKRGAGGQCIGTPACPRGFRLQGKSCLRVDPTLIRRDGTCPAGREITEDRCCWPEQDWLDGACSGRPRCPRGYRRTGEDCVIDEGDE